MWGYAKNHQMGIPSVKNLKTPLDIETSDPAFMAAVGLKMSLIITCGAPSHSRSRSIRSAEH